tara:strand:+ start:10157 stop:10894 length:738 start_codon:yes stop_codon:yes gene_type:complete
MKRLNLQAHRVTQLFVLLLSFSSFFALAETEKYRDDLPPVLDDTGWDLMLEENGVKVFTRDWPGSSFIAIKAVQMIHSPVSNIVANFSDIDAFPDWVKDMADAYEVEPFDENRSRKIYMRMGLPWPLGDRDIVSGQKLTQDKQTKIVRIKEWHEGTAIPEKDGVIRMPRLNNEFVLIPEGVGLTRMVWQGHTEPGGLIPAFLVNWLVEDVFYESVMNMRKRFETPEFNKTADWVVDFTTPKAEVL